VVLKVVACLACCVPLVLCEVRKVKWEIEGVVMGE